MIAKAPPNAQAKKPAKTRSKRVRPEVQLNSKELAEERRDLFAAAVAAGKSASEAARIAGYDGPSVGKTAFRLAHDPRVRQLVEEKRALTAGQRIASPQQLLEFWTSVMRGEIDGDDGMPARLSDRIKAAELVGKANGVFTNTTAETQMIVRVMRSLDAVSALKTAHAQVVQDEKPPQRAPIPISSPERGTGQNGHHNGAGLASPVNPPATRRIVFTPAKESLS